MLFVLRVSAFLSLLGYSLALVFGLFLLEGIGWYNFVLGCVCFILFMLIYLEVKKMIKFKREDKEELTPRVRPKLLQKTFVSLEAESLDRLVNDFASAYPVVARELSTQQFTTQAPDGKPTIALIFMCLVVFEYTPRETYRGGF